MAVNAPLTVAGLDRALRLEGDWSTTTTPLTTGDDSFAAITLSQPIPVPGGTTANLVACSNGYLTLSGQDQGADYSPTVAEFEAFAEPTICGNWYDYNPSAGGLITFEENGGFDVDQ